MCIEIIIKLTTCYLSSCKADIITIPDIVAKLENMTIEAI